MHGEEDQTKPERWALGNLPFFYRHLDTPSNASHGLPDLLPFALEEDDASGLIRQSFEPSVAKALDEAYRQGSILSGAMEEEGLGQKYAKDFLHYIRTRVPDFRGRRILEIGCGSGYLLSLLRDLGASVIGIEPGPQGNLAHQRFGVSVIKDFFPSHQVRDRFDVILAYAVLEHLPDPWQFLQDVRKQLTPRGVAILAVPDCEPYLQSGDLSCLIHEHWSYFTAESLRGVVEGAGMSADVAPAGFGGCLYCVVRLDGAKHVAAQSRACAHLSIYRQRSFRMLQRLEKILCSALNSGKTVGIYAAGRMLNALSLLPKLDSNAQGFRFFDDNELLHRKYYPGWPISIESWTDYVKHPPELTIVASRSFGPQITARLMECHPKGRVLGWSDLFSAAEDDREC